MAFLGEELKRKFCGKHAEHGNHPWPYWIHDHSEKCRLRFGGSRCNCNEAEIEWYRCPGVDYVPTHRKDIL